MKIPTAGDIPTPSTLFSNAHSLYDQFSTSITKMTAPLDREEDLWPQFEVSAQSVTNAFKKFEENVVAPTAKFMEAAFRRYPITSTFVSVFVILVSLPFLSFLGFIVFVVASTTFASLSAALFASVFIIGLYGTLLSMLVILLTALSAWISTSLVFGYIAWRFFILVRTDGREGVWRWSAETTNRFRRQKKQARERRGRSPGSVVSVKGEETEPLSDQQTSETVKQ